MAIIAVIDTETNWSDQVMSIGTVLAGSQSFQPIASKYHILTPECHRGGMYSDALYSHTPVPPITCTRETAMRELKCWFAENRVECIFAYNAAFDRNHLPELSKLRWYDIMRLAAYRQHNPRIGPAADCCSTGRLKRGYGVEAMLRLLSGNCRYRETHNALLDALDELEIMRLLRHSVEDYIPL